MNLSPTRLVAPALATVGLGCLLAFGTGALAAGLGVATLETPGPDTASPEPSAQVPDDPQQAMLDFAECMRDHGIDMPDPVFSSDGTGGGVFTVHADASPATDGGAQGAAPGDGQFFGADPEFQAAQEACGGNLEAALPPIDPEQQAEMQEQMLAFTQCMRDHGVDMPDPQIMSGGAVSIGGGPDSGFDPSSPAFQAAQEACGADGPFGFGAAPVEQP